MDRRTFIRLGGAGLVASGVPACHSSGSDAPDSAVDTGGGAGADTVAPDVVPFPFGVASADPGPDRITVWTQAEQLRANPGPVHLELSREAELEKPRVWEMPVADAASDFTVQLTVSGLEPDTYYHYRFVDAAGNVSRLGRTRTAPPPDSDAPVDFVFASCQRYQSGYYGAYREMINDESAGEFSPRFVLHLGDFLYETVETAGEGGGPVRPLSAMPDGADLSARVRHAVTLADYRHLYRQMLSDRDLQAARALWPFVHTWDDHEFSNDCWQSEANYRDGGENGSTDEPSQRRRVAATQAWSEYVPADLSADPVGPARPFVPVSVNDTRNQRVTSDNLAANEDNLRAIGAITVYRQLRFGRVLQLQLTDNRSWRSDHALPEELSAGNPLLLQSRYLLPENLVRELDAGETAGGGNPDTFLLIGELTLNPRRNSPVGSMLGTTQRRWWQSTLLSSDAAWNIWGNPLPIQPLRVDTSRLFDGVPDIVLSADAWDGYPSERDELLGFLHASNITNVVSLSGDIHAFAAAAVRDAGGAVVLHEFVCAGLSSTSQYRSAERLSRFTDPTPVEARARPLVAIDVAAGGQLNNLDTTLLRGSVAATARAEALSGLGATATSQDRAPPDGTVDPRDANDRSGPNPDLLYIDTDANGFGRVTATSARLAVELITTGDVEIDHGTAGPGKRRVARFELDRDGPGAPQRLSGASLSGAVHAPFDGELASSTARTERGD